jgi:transposase
VVCVDEKSQIQALERTQPLRPVASGRVERRTHDYVRHGTTTLFAALEVAIGQVTDACHPRHRHGEFLGFLKLVARAYPCRQLHVVLDNYATHEHAKVQAWLASHPRVHLHFTPTYASWLNLVEVFFAVIERQALRRGDFAAWMSWWQRSGGSVAAGTNAASRFAGPRRPTRSSPSSSIKQLSNGPLGGRWAAGHAAGQQHRSHPGPGHLLRAGLCIEVASELVLAVTRTPWVAGATLILFGAHAMVWGVVTVSLRQRLVPERLRGRVNSVYFPFDLGGAALGTPLGGGLASALSITAPFWLARGTVALLVVAA